MIFVAKNFTNVNKQWPPVLMNPTAKHTIDNPPARAVIPKNKITKPWIAMLLYECSIFKRQKQSTPQKMKAFKNSRKTVTSDSSGLVSKMVSTEDLIAHLIASEKRPAMVRRVWVGFLPNRTWSTRDGLEYKVRNNDSRLIRLVKLGCESE